MAAVTKHRAGVGLRSRIRFLGPVVMLLSWAAAPAVAREDAWNARTVSLKNGMLVLLAPDSLATSADVAVWYRAGSRVERAGMSGMTHLMAQLMDQGLGPGGPGERRRLIETEGGTSNSTTNPDFSCFYETGPPEAVPLALRLEAGRMRSLPADAQGLDRARLALEAERRARIDSNPVARGLQRLYAVAFSQHPYGRPLIGSDADLRRVTLADVEQYRVAWYVPSQALLTIVGRFDPDATLDQVRENFDPLPGRSPAPGAETPLPEPRGGQRVTESAATPVPVLVVGWRGPADTDSTSPAIELLARILAGGPTSRLERQLVVSHREFLSIQSDFDRRQQASMLYCVAAIRAGADTAAAERALINEVERLAAQPALLGELDRAKRQIAAGLLFDWQTARGRAHALGVSQILDGDFREATRRLDRIRRLSAADLQRAAEKILTPGNRSVVWIVPSSQPATPSGPEGSESR